jgi:hypothetical protein
MFDGDGKVGRAEQQSESELDGIWWGGGQEIKPTHFGST